MGRRGEHSIQELSTMIVDAACEILNNEGYGKLSTRKIASKIGYTVGTLYNVFQNTDDIFIHINSRTLDNLIQEITKAAGLNNGLSSVKNLARSYMRFSKDNLQYWSMLFEYQFPEDQAFPRWYKQKVDTLYEIVWHAIEKSVKNVKQEKQKEYVSIVWGGIHGITILSLKGKFQRAGIDSAEPLLDDFIDTYLKGMKAA